MRLRWRDFSGSGSGDNSQQLSGAHGDSSEAAGAHERRLARDRQQRALVFEAALHTQLVDSLQRQRQRENACKTLLFGGSSRLAGVPDTRINWHSVKLTHCIVYRLLVLERTRM